MTERAIELRIIDEGQSIEEVEAEAIEHLQAMGFEDFSDLDIEHCDGYYCVRLGGDFPEGCCPGDGGGLLGAPRSESKTLGEVKKKFTK